MSTADTIPARLFANAEAQPKGPAYHTFVGGKWRTFSWAAFADQVRDAGRAMMALGVQRGMCLPILSANRPEWAIFGLAAMSIGSSAAGLYINQDSDQIQEILAHAEAPLVLVDTRELWEKINAKRDKLPLLRQIVMMPGAEPVEDPLTLTWEAFMATGDITNEDEFFQRLKKVAPEQVATYAYTFEPDHGPKGVMLSHNNLTWTASVMAELLAANPRDRGFSNLPQAHITEQLFSLHLPITARYPVYYGRSFGTFFDDLKHAQPTLLFTLPQVWQQIAQRTRHTIAQMRGTQATMTHWACRQGAKASALLMDGYLPDFPLSWKLAFARGFSLQPLKATMGLTHVRFCTSSLTPLSSAIADLLAAIELPVFELYGKDETTGIALLNLPGTTKQGTVGLPLPEVEHDLDEAKSLKLRGPNIFIGYYKNQRLSSANLKFGWYHTHQDAYVDDDGYVTFKDR